ncbi:hypothetical protein BH20ACT3_BH20ACT3_10530 [soil metagenome]
MDPITITRSVRIAAVPEVVWNALADADGLAGWLGGAVALDVEAGAAGSIIDPDGTTRQLVVTEIHPSRRLGFVWWDEDRPGDVSSVTITLDRDHDGSRVTVTETLDPAAAIAGGGLAGRASALASAEVGDLAARWDARLARLVGTASVAVVGIGA